MKKLLSEWRRYIIESQTEFNGILMLKPNINTLSYLESIQAMLPEEAVRISLEDLHVTLLHQSVLKPFQDKIRDLTMPEPPQIKIDNEVFERKSPGKKSWAVRLSNQDEIRQYVFNVLEMLGSNNLDPEPERRFHVSLANLTGNPKDSVR